MNIFNVAIIARAFLFFSYPTKMSGDAVWVAEKPIFGLGNGNLVDCFTGATPLGQFATGSSHLTNAVGDPLTTLDMFIGLIPGSIGETGKIAILLGAVLLLFTGIASWKTMISVFVGGALTGLLFNQIGSNPVMNLPWYDHLLLGGFIFGAVFMATDPVTSARTETGKYIFGFLVGVLAILIRMITGYPEGMMLALILMNVFAPLIDYSVMKSNIKRRLKRVKVEN